MARGKAHDEETKAAIVAALLAGQAVSEISRTYSLPETTVRRMRNQLNPDKLAEVGGKKENRIDELLVLYLEANLTALAVQSRVAGDETYLKRFPPQQLAVLHGVMADKAVRLIEAGARADSEGGGPEEGSGSESEDESETFGD